MEYPSGSSAVCAFIPYEVLLQSSAQWLLGRPPRRGTAVCGGAAFSLLLNDSLHRFPHFAILTFNFHCLLRASTVTHTRKTHRREQRGGCRVHTDIQCSVHSFVETLHGRRKKKWGAAASLQSAVIYVPLQSEAYFSSPSSRWMIEPHFIEWHTRRFTFICPKCNFSLCPLKRDGPVITTGDVYSPFLFCRWTVEAQQLQNKELLVLIFRVTALKARFVSWLLERGDNKAGALQRSDWCGTLLSHHQRCF